LRTSPKTPGRVLKTTKAALYRFRSISTAAWAYLAGGSTRNAGLMEDTYGGSLSKQTMDDDCASKRSKSADSKRRCTSANAN
jgi:hypothetical protein